MLSLLITTALGATAALASQDLTERFSNPQTCVVPSNGNLNVSDTPAIHAAFKKCGKGGRIIFSEGKTYALNELTVSVGYCVSIAIISNLVTGDDPMQELHC